MRNIPHKPNSWPTYRASCPTFLAPPGGNQQNPSERQHCGLECGRFLGEIRSQFYVELSELYMFQVWHDWPRSNQLLALLGGVIFVERFMIPCSKFNDLSSYIIILIPPLNWYKDSKPDLLFFGSLTNSFSWMLNALQILVQHVIYPVWGTVSDRWTKNSWRIDLLVFYNLKPPCLRINQLSCHKPIYIIYKPLKNY